MATNSLVNTVDIHAGNSLSAYGTSMTDRELFHITLRLFGHALGMEVTNPEKAPSGFDGAVGELLARSVAHGPGEYGVYV